MHKMDIYELFYRNPDRTIDGQIATFEKLELNPIHNDVGTWSLQAPVEVLLSLVWKGGLVVKRNNDVFFTGRVTSMHRVKDKTAFPVIDTLEVSGVDDNSYLEDQLVLPVSSGPPYTSAEFDVRTGPFETVAKDYVSSTIGPNAKIDRQVTGLTIETDYARGSQVTGQGRFNRLLELLKSIALQSGGIGFRVVNMQFQVYPINDKSSFVVFSEDLGNLCGFTYDIDRPKANYIYLGGTGSGSSRVIAEGLNSDSILQYERIEEFLDQSMPSIVITLDDNERIIHWNKEAEKFTGYSSTEAVGRILWDFIPEFSKYRIKCDELRKNRNTIELRKEIFVKEGCGAEESFVKNIFIFPFSKKDINGIIIRIDDITELEKNEERLSRASKVEALGTMAGGLAHDFNNIISGIISTASYLDMIIKDSNVNVNEISFHLDVIKKSGGKAALLVKNLMSVSRDEGDNFEKINLEQITRDVVAIARPSVPEYIELTFHSVLAESTMSGNRSQLEQVILNLIVNASEAIMKSNVDKPVISLLLDNAED